MHTCFSLKKTLWLLAVFLIGVGPVRADLAEYVKKADPSYEWKLKEKIETDAGTIYDLHLVSQTWQKIKWEHQLQVYVPKGVKPTETIVLLTRAARQVRKASWPAWRWPRKPMLRSPSCTAFPISRCSAARRRTPSLPRRLSAI